jgi:hypothetical protein
MVTNDAGAAEQQFRRARVTFVSPGIVTLVDGKLGFQKGLVVRDPDGHVVELVEKRAR